MHKKCIVNKSRTSIHKKQHELNIVFYFVVRVSNQDDIVYDRVKRKIVNEQI